MLVDDDFNTVNLLQMLLEMDGFEVISAPGGEEAMARAKEARPDAFLVDYHLADYKGVEVVRQLRAEADFANAPIIMTSGLDRSDDALAAGATEFLMKPFEPNQLIARLQALLG
jgi:two-component system OmpR family response regulator